jgi:hypothetical protein
VNNYYIHQTTRRLRVRIPALKANAKVAQELQATMLELTGVASVEINPLTGSVLVHHDGERSTLERVFGFMERRGLWPGRGPDCGKTAEFLFALRADTTTGQQDRITPSGW